MHDLLSPYHSSRFSAVIRFITPLSSADNYSLRATGRQCNGCSTACGAIHLHASASVVPGRGEAPSTTLATCTQRAGGRTAVGFVPSGSRRAASIAQRAERFASTRPPQPSLAEARRRQRPLLIIRVAPTSTMVLVKECEVRGTSTLHSLGIRARGRILSHSVHDPGPHSVAFCRILSQRVSRPCRPGAVR